MSRPLTLVFDEAQFRAGAPGEASYVLRLISGLLKEPGSEVRLLAPRASARPLDPRLRGLASGLARLPFTRMSDLLPAPGSGPLPLRALGKGARLLSLPIERALCPTQLAFALRGLPRRTILHQSRFLPLFVPPAWRARSVATIHDLLPLTHPEFFPADIPPLVAANLARFTANTAALFCVSDYTRRTLLARSGLDGARVFVTPCGVDERFYAAQPDESEFSTLRQKHAIPFARYFLFVGTIEPRKNLLRILAAQEALADELGEGAPGLLVAGNEGWMCARELAALKASAARGRALWLKGLSDDELALLYARAQGLVWPSLAEGFGLPVAEAMAAGCPVITSRATSLPEVAGQAALMVEARETGEIARAMKRLAAEPELARRLALAGREEAERFRLERTARIAKEAYETILHNAEASHEL